MSKLTSASIPATQDRAYTPAQVAEVMNVTVYTVYEWLTSGDLRGIKLRKNWRIMRSDLDEFIANRRRNAVAEYPAKEQEQEQEESPK